MRSGSTCTMLGVRMYSFGWFQAHTLHWISMMMMIIHSLTTCSVLSALCCALLDSPTVYCEEEQTSSKKSPSVRVLLCMSEDRIAKPDPVFTTFHTNPTPGKLKHTTDSTSPCLFNKLIKNGVDTAPRWEEISNDHREAAVTAHQSVKGQRGSLQTLQVCSCHRRLFAGFFFSLSNVPSGASYTTWLSVTKVSIVRLQPFHFEFQLRSLCVELAGPPWDLSRVDSSHWVRGSCNLLLLHTGPLQVLSTYLYLQNPHPLFIKVHLWVR